MLPSLDEIDYQAVETPVTICDLPTLKRNIDLLSHIQTETGCEILLALKAFAMWSVFDRLNRGLAGVSAASPDEARLGHEKFGGHVHTFASAYKAEEMAQTIAHSSHLIFNSIAQWQRFGKQALAGGCEVGLRINPQHSEAKQEIYDPCQKNSRLGITADQLQGVDLTGVTGLHFHNLCNNGADALARTAQAVEEKFGPYLKQMRWINLGGGHMITSDGYDLKTLYRVIRGFQQRYGLQVILEPGEAVVRDAGVLVGEVLDIVPNPIPVAILDLSAAAHMPDVLEMPYRPDLIGAGEMGEKKHGYRLTGSTCLAGDTIGDYSFDQPLTIGQRLVFLDMAQYTMVKNTFFNGIRLPAIAIHHGGGEVEVVRRFSYDDFLTRLS
uniref:Carboxynorspermidine/carboxyspermidine decarboxylase n=1 Tax=Magnetococcus massalia (strain MO-1) TaxID=451514 RepID=A0A1S7LM95_MAGMO|nr:Putative carboxynorspermidine decarboxylase [Candidatus Magnetococcus massalia]